MVKLSNEEVETLSTWAEAVIELGFLNDPETGEPLELDALLACEHYQLVTKIAKHLEGEENEGD